MRAPAPAQPGRRTHDQGAACIQDAPPHWPPGPRPRMHRRTERLARLGDGAQPPGPREKGAWRLWPGARGLPACRCLAGWRSVPVRSLRRPCSALVLTQAEAMPRLPVSQVPGPFPRRSRPGSSPGPSLRRLGAAAYRPRQSRLWDLSQDSSAKRVSLVLPHGFL